jgi:hypothetical protein
LKPAALTAFLILLAVSVAHLMRLLLRVPITASGIQIPLWVSLFGCVVPGAVAVLLWKEQH